MSSGVIYWQTVPGENPAAYLLKTNAKGVNSMEMVKLLSLFGLAVVELWVAIPAGFAMKIHPLTIGIVSAAGAFIGVVLVVLLGERFRHWILKRRSRDEGPAKNRSSRRATMERIWHQYGIAGLGLLAPLLTGAPLGAVLGLALGTPPARLITWMGVGIIIWTAILTTVAAFGLAGINLLR